MRPLFVVLEALDGVGKTTLASTLAARLGGTMMNTPGRELGTCSRAVLDALGPHQPARCLFYAASVLVAGERARALVDRGAPVVMDRYWLSTISYARARGVDLDVTAIEAVVPAPDVTVLVTLDEDVRQRRLRDRGCTEADLETLAPEFRRRVLAEMRSAARPPPLRPTVSVDVTEAGPEEAADRVVRGLVDAGFG